jgi:hypothetical protein
MVRMRVSAGSSAVREVLNRTLGIGTVALLMVGFLGAGLVLAPQGSARAGGMMVGRATFSHGGFLRSGGPLVRPGQQVPPVVMSGSPAVVNPVFGVERERHHRRFFGFGFPVAGVGFSYGPFDEPFPYFGAIARPQVLPLIQEDNDRILVNHSDCRSETRLVASEEGGERPIKITWCQKG